MTGGAQRGRTTCPKLPSYLSGGAGIQTQVSESRLASLALRGGNGCNPAAGDYEGVGAETFPKARVEGQGIFVPCLFFPPQFRGEGARQAELVKLGIIL